MLRVTRFRPVWETVCWVRFFNILEIPTSKRLYQSTTGIDLEENLQVGNPQINSTIFCNTIFTDLKVYA